MFEMLYFALANNDNRDCGSPLDCWLDGLVFIIPDPSCITFEGQRGCISRFTCSKSGFTLIRSSYLFPSSVAVDVVNVHTICHGAWKYSYFGGFVTVNLINTDISTSILFVDEKLTVAKCSIPNMVIEFHFSGGFGSLLQTLSKLFDKPLRSQIRSFVCDDLFPKIALKSSDFITHVIDPYLSNIISSQASPIHALPSNYFNWNSSSTRYFHKYMKSLISGRNLQSISEYFPKDIDFRMIDLHNKSFFFEFRTSKNLTSVLGNVTLTAHKLHLVDMEGITVDPLTPAISNVSVATLISIRKVTASVSMSVEVYPADKDLSGDVLVEFFDVHIVVENFTATLDVALIVSHEYVSGLHGDQISDPYCLIAIPKEMFVDSVVAKAQISSVGLQSSGSSGGRLYRAESGVDKLLNESLRVLTDGSPQRVSDIFAGALQGPLRQHLNKLLSGLRESSSCPEHRPRNGSDIIDWRKLRHLGVQKDRISVAGLVSAAVDARTDGTGAVVLRTPSGWTVGAAGLDSFFNLSLADFNVSSGLFHASVGIGEGCGLSGLCGMRPVSGHAVGRVKGQRTNVVGSASFLQASVALFASVDVNVLRNMNVSQLSRPHCLVSALNSLGVRDLQASIGDVEASVDGVDVGNVAQEFTERLFGLTRVEDTSSAINLLLNVALEDASRRCFQSIPAKPSGDEPKDPFWASRTFATSATVGIACLVTAFLVRSRNVRRSECEAQKDKSGVFSRNGNINVSSEDDLVEPPRTETSLPFATEKRESLHPVALSYRQDLSLCLRLALPVLISANICLFLFANFSTGARVTLSAVVSSHVFSPSEPVFLFSLGDTVRDMWRAKVYPLALLIAFFSGAWPYTKLLVLLFACLAPARWLGRVEGLLALTDKLGKWSLVDVFVLVLMMGAFHVVVDLSGGLRVVVNVVPETGFYAFLLATLGSLLLGQHVLHYFRKGRPLSAADTSEDRSREAVLSHCFDTTSGRVRATSFGAFVLSALLILLLPVLLASYFLPTFEFNFGGLLGWILGEAADSTFSLWTLCESLPEASGLGASAGVRAIQLVVLMVGLLAPLLSVLSLASLWSTPLRLRQQEALLQLAEYAIAWSALDVQALSLFAALLQVRRFASFVVGDMCDLINDAISSSASAVELLRGNAKCFDVEATLTRDAWLIFAAAVLLVVASQIVSQLARRCIRERKGRATSQKYGSIVDALPESGRLPQDSLLERLIDSVSVGASVPNLGSPQATPQVAETTKGLNFLLFFGFVERMPFEPLV